MNEKLIVVLGVTGTQGSSVASTFLQLDGWRVRGITRNPDSANAQTQAAKGVDVVKGDLNDVESLKAAFLGATAIFAVTDFWTIFPLESTAKGAEAAGKTANEFAYELEVGQGINIATAASDPDVLATLERLVFSTLSSPKEVSGGKYTWAFHLDSKTVIEENLRKSPELEKLLSTVNLGFFAENFRKFPGTAPIKQEDGSFIITTLQADERTPLPWVIAGRDTGVFVKALVVDHEPGTHVQGVSETLSADDYAALWGRIFGIKTKAKVLLPVEFANSQPENLRRETMEALQYISEFGYFGVPGKWKSPQELGIKTSTMEEFIRGEDWKFVGIDQGGK